ncbi:Phosphonoacetaldehyde hydrolase [Pseudobythopirellula maris]|uniref:Phosphonoacetaldehyde hydrolase n=1 Tax=Pseudobythopirellula maris TaxID=2527991 RepID=A0A5C5ZKF5_9BACT|nr:phosphonoacetaldehyde hydrolase [Pseudobythopirellula maris]TWT87618.1 Phosphonoacetaldehyde hydrolase [Pseudobythopirellula maris]
MIEVEPRRLQDSEPLTLRAVVLDWAGTTVDYGSRAPITAILAAFDEAGFPVTEAEARQPMGRAKRDHLQTLLAIPEVAARWRDAKGRPSEESDIDYLYENFLRVQAGCVAEHSGLIPGCLEAIASCREMGLKIGSSTGYTRELLAAVAERACGEGYTPDVMLSADDVSPGRPAPWLCVENARRLGVYPMASVVKVDDTPAGVAAGRNAGAWSVGVVQSGNEVGLTLEAFDALAPERREAAVVQACERLTKAGAHFLIDTIAELPAVVERINEKLVQGERP